MISASSVRAGAMAGKDSSALLAVKVVPGSSRDRVAGRYADGVKVQVSAPPEKGKANAAVIQALAAWLGVNARQVELVAGHTSPRKRFRISGIDSAALSAKVAAL